MNSSLCRHLVLITLACVFPCAIATALELGEKPGDDDIAALLGEEPTRDYGFLAASHLSTLIAWENVKLSTPPKDPPAAAPHWQQDGALVTPLDDGAISTLIDVPETANYRVYLRHQLGTNVAYPVTLSMTPQNSPNTPPMHHVYGQIKLGGGMTGKELEKNRPVRFEADAQLLSVPADNVLAWEYWDVEIKKGIYRADLTKADKHVRASTLLLTRSKDFRPSLATTIGRIFMRFRAVDPNSKPETKVTIYAGLGYHWGPRQTRGSKEGAWSWNIGTTAATAIGRWSAFIDATDAIVPGPGPWSSCNLNVNGMQKGELEVQFAWFPHEKAVAHSLKTGVGASRAMLRVPHGAWTPSPQPGVAAWGMWSNDSIKQIVSQEGIIERYFTWAQQAADRLGLKDGHPRPKQIRLFCGNGALPSAQERAAEMLAKLGVNWIDRAPASVVKKYGLYDETSAFNTADAAGLARGMSDVDKQKLTKVKIGDEIGTRTDPALINADAAKREKFHAYLKAQAQLEGMDIPTFLGVEDLSAIDCLGELSSNPGRYERRVFYHSQRFCHLITCDEYRAATQGFEHIFPNARVYNNYSPHPLFLTGATMNGSDWFVLPRNKAQTLGWAEDWATSGGWGLGTAYQCTSFYAALIDCAVRKHGYPFGFYVGANCGGSAEKIFSCVAQGASVLHLYDWGPIDSWAEGSNAWSEHQSEYYAVMCAACAIGPADEIIAKGKREPRRTAILYNRSHEILQEGAGRLNHDWMWIYIALKSSQIPVDVIIEEDLNPNDLMRYDCVILGGFNLAKSHMLELSKWVETGGLLIGTGGAAMYDIYNDPLQESVNVFGARQRQTGAKEKASTSRVVIQASDFFPDADFAPTGLTFRLEPTTGKILAKYSGGECAATINTLGKGKAILLGFHPGLAFRDNDKATGKLRALLAAPVLKHLSRQRLEFDHHASEATLFEHESGLAVMLASFGGPSPETGTLSVKTDRPIKDVQSALRGPLEWKRVGDRIEIKTLRLEPVDVVILR